MFKTSMRRNHCRIINQDPTGKHSDIERDDRPLTWINDITIFNANQIKEINNIFLAELLQDYVLDLADGHYIYVGKNNYLIERLVDPGLHYCSMLAKIYIKYGIINVPMKDYKKGSGNLKSIHEYERILVVKSLPKGEMQVGSDSLPSFMNRPRAKDFYKMGRTERIFYQRIWPAIQELSDLTDNRSRDHIVPRYYVVNDSKIWNMYMDDLTEQFLEIRDRGYDLDFDHMKVALQFIARLHAASLILNKKGFSEDYRYSLPPRGECAMHPDHIYFYIFTSGLRVLALEMNSWMGLERFVGTLQNMASNAYHAMIEFRKAGKLKLVVHGDFWHSNIFFNYKECDNYGSRNRIPESSRFIDFQWCQWGSPAIDILTLFYVSAEPEVFLKHRLELINIYHSEMIYEISKYSDKFSKSVIFFKNELNQDIRNMEYYGLYLGLTYRWIRRANRNVIAPFVTLMNGECFKCESFWRTVIRKHRRELEPAYKVFLTNFYDG